VAGVRRAIILLALAGAAAAPAAARAGQIVWVSAPANGSPSALWAANDDGTFPHRLLSSTAAPLTSAVPSGVIGDPDLFQRSGTIVAFTDSLNGVSSQSFTLASGTLSSDAPQGTGAAFESQPRFTSNGQLVEQYVLYPLATSSTLGMPSVAGLFARPLGNAAIGPPWGDTATEPLAQRADPAPDPVDPSLLAWVQIEDPSCTQFSVHGSAVCQYEVHVGSATSTSAPPVAIYDDETPFGSGPSSLAWSSDGRNLLIVDDEPPNDGIYEVAATTSVPAATKKVMELIAEPPGWTFGQARFVGSKVVFDAHGAGHSTPNTSDIYEISSKCDSGTCSFPASAVNLTHNATANNISPAWTSAAAPLIPYGASAGGPAVLDAAAIRARTVKAAQGATFEVTMSAASPLSVSISRNGHTIGTTTLHLQAGATTFTLKTSGGHALTAGHDVAKLRVGSSTRVRWSTSFTVH
jgi:hypothetical protein